MGLPRGLSLMVEFCSPKAAMWVQVLQTSPILYLLPYIIVILPIIIVVLCTIISRLYPITAIF